MGKGDKWRKNVDFKKYRDNYDFWLNGGKTNNMPLNTNNCHKDCPRPDNANQHQIRH